MRSLYPFALATAAGTPLAIFGTDESRHEPNKLLRRNDPSRPWTISTPTHITLAARFSFEPFLTSLQVLLLLLLLRKGAEAQPQHMSVITTTAVTSMPQITVHVPDFYDDHRSLEHVLTQPNLSGQQA